MVHAQEHKNQRIGWIISIAIHAILFLLFYFIISWQAPDPPLPEYGVLLNFGTTEVGSGDIQPEQQQANPVTPSKEESQDKTEEQTPSEENPVKPADDTGKENTADEAATESPTQEEPSPVTNKAAESADSKKSSTKSQQDQNEKPKALYPTKSDKTNKSQGNGNTKEQGDQGDKKGELNAKALMGNPGGGGGSSLDMAGWAWDYIPKPNDTSDEEGKIVFQIKVDDRGEVISVITLEKTVSPSVEKVYKNAVYKLTFSPTSENTSPAPVSTGKITFIIRAK